MKKIIAIFLMLLSLGICKAQNINTMWLMGYDCCTPQSSGMNLDFSSSTLVISAVTRYMNFSETNSEICDSTGQLLFYANGIYVANALDDTMMNGSGLNQSVFTTQMNNYGLTLPQGNLIIPIPDQPNKYYLFHETCDECVNLVATFYLYYSVIDMTLDAGKGAVTQKNVILLDDTLVPGRITATKHANGRDWWIVVHKNYNGFVFKYLVTPYGIQGPMMQNLSTYRDVDFGQAIFSSQGDKFAYYDAYQDLDIWNFDRCNGNFYAQIHIGINDSAVAGGIAFSSSGRFLYVSSMNYIYQYDLQAANVQASQITVGVYDGFLSGGFVANFYLAALAPDYKIYINCGNSTKDIHVINYPDSAGLACDFCQHCIHLPAFNAFTIPNHPNYFLGAETGTVCDSLTGISDIKNPVSEFLLFPNPTNKDLYLTLSKDKIQSVSVYNSVGQLVFAEDDVIKNEYLHFDVSKLEVGFYYVEVLTTKERVTRKFVKE